MRIAGQCPYLGRMGHRTDDEVPAIPVEPDRYRAREAIDARISHARRDWRLDHLLRDGIVQDLDEVSLLHDHPPLALCEMARKYDSIGVPRALPSAQPSGVRSWIWSRAVRFAPCSISQRATSSRRRMTARCSPVRPRCTAPSTLAPSASNRAIASSRPFEGRECEGLVKHV